MTVEEDPAYMPTMESISSVSNTVEKCNYLQEEQCSETHTEEPSQNENHTNVSRDSESPRKNTNEQSCETQCQHSAEEEKTTIKPSDEEFPECLLRLLEGINISGDSKCSLNSKPDWVDMDKYRKGQQFAMKHWAGLCYANMLSLLAGLSFRRFLEPLIFTGKSDTPFKAFKRYLSTVNKVYSWYQGNIFDPNDPAHKDIKAVRYMHHSVMKRMNSMTPEEVKDKVTLGGVDGCCRALWNEVDDEVFQAFKDACPAPISIEYPYNVFTTTAVGGTFISQFDMAVTQMGFIGAILLFPKQFGVHKASREELEGFVHFWRCVGYLLGIEDRFNICSGSLEETLEIIKNISKYWSRPSLREMTRDGEHMGRCMIEGLRHYLPTVLYNTTIAYGCWLYEIKAYNSDKLIKSLNWVEWFMFIFSRFVFSYYIRLPGVRQTSNWLVKKAISRANNMSPSWLRRKENKVYSYQMQPEMICTRL